jgi:hypothetical protein
MKCPGCGIDVTGKEVCSQCGRKCDIPPEEIEVEYKNFTISEFLEIRPKSSGSHRQPEAVCVREEKALQGERKTVYASKEKTGGKNIHTTGATRKNPSQQRVPVQTIPSFPLVLAVLLLLVVVIGAWYLWRFLTMP